MGIVEDLESTRILGLQKIVVIHHNYDLWFGTSVVRPSGLESFLEGLVTPKSPLNNNVSPR